MTACPRMKDYSCLSVLSAAERLDLCESLIACGEIARGSVWEWLLTEKGALTLDAAALREFEDFRRRGKNISYPELNISPGGFL